MPFHGPLRAGLYSALLIFSIILVGLTAQRVYHTDSIRTPDPFDSRTNYYEPTTVELLSTGVLAILFSLPLMACLCSHRGGSMLSYLLELAGIFTLFVMFLVGASIFTNRFRGVSRCTGFFSQCRIVSAIMAFGWMCWIITLILLLTAIAALFYWRKHGNANRDRRHHRGAAAAAAGAGVGTLAADEHDRHDDTAAMGTGFGNDKHHDPGVGTAVAAGTGAAVGDSSGYFGNYQEGTGPGTGAYKDNSGYGTGTGAGAGAIYGAAGGTGDTYGTGIGTGTGTNYGTGDTTSYGPGTGNYSTGTNYATGNNTNYGSGTGNYGSGQGAYATDTGNATGYSGGDGHYPGVNNTGTDGYKISPETRAVQGAGPIFTGQHNI